MQHLEDSIHVDASIDDVFDYIADPSNMPEWVPNMVEVSNVRGEGKGSTFEWIYKMVGLRMAGNTEITEFEENKLVEHHSSGAIKSTWRHELDRHSGQTRVKLSIDYEVPSRVGKKIAEKILLRQHQREMKVGLNALKEIVEYSTGRGKAAE
jgi:uncharacterized membrane protein